MSGNKVLEIQNLTVDFYHEGSFRTVVKGVSYSVERGKTLGIVGESGSGKSVSSMAVMGLLPSNGKCKISGNIWYYDANGNKTDLLTLTDEQMRNYRGRHISMIFQEPMTSLNPVHTCGEQIIEVLQTHQKISYHDAYDKALSLMEEVLIPRPEKIMKSYPHQVSGGQKQRVMIAMALACNPDVLISDEPTTALDVTVQKTILELLANLQQKYGMAIVFITHDLGVIANIAHDVAVLYKGEIVEHKSTGELFANPSHPYTKGLLACRPSPLYRLKKLPVVADFLKQGTDQPIAHLLAINSYTQQEIDSRRAVLYDTPPLLEVKNLCTWFPVRNGLFGSSEDVVKAVDDVSFKLYPGETLGLVGESGCGKTTLGRTILRLIEPSSGSISFAGQDITHLKKEKLRALRKDIQLIFQDPYSSLNSQLTVGNALMEPLQVHNVFNSNAERKAHVQHLLELVDLKPEHFNRYPHEFSGGQRQRIVIARALALQPKLIICDESVSALDVSVQAQVLNLLRRLQQEMGLTYIFISHDLAVVKHLSDRMIVMNKGKIEEEDFPEVIYEHPQTAYTQKLIAAIPGKLSLVR